MMTREEIIAKSMDFVVIFDEEAWSKLVPDSTFCLLIEKTLRAFEHGYFHDWAMWISGHRRTGKTQILNTLSYLLNGQLEQIEEFMAKYSIFSAY